MKYSLVTRQPNGEMKDYTINTDLIAYYSHGEEGISGNLEVEIGFSGGMVLHLIVDQQAWDAFVKVFNPEKKRKRAGAAY
jgi:hypothetical protein